jgi:hypothetical protein
MRKFAKILNMRYIIFFSSLLFIYACSNHANKPHNARETAQQNTTEGLQTEAIKATGNSFMDSYLKFAEALVINKLDEAKLAYTNFKTAALNYNSDNLAVPMPLSNIQKIMSDTSAQTIQTMRSKLKELNAPMFEIAKINGGFGVKVYNQYCPMAFNNKGAKWLSTKPEIRNPYFGDEMLDCGAIEDSINVK